MIIHLYGDVDYNMFDKVVTAGNNLKKDDNLHVYFTSPEGGATDVAEALIDYINKNKEFISVSFYGEIFSSGMIIFLKLKCNKYILPDTRGMYHFAWQQMSITEGGKPSSKYDLFSMKEMRFSKQKTIDFLKTTKLNTKEINEIKSGKDVYFSYNRLIELI